MVGIAAAFVLLPTKLVATVVVLYIFVALARSSSIARGIM